MLGEGYGNLDEPEFHVVAYDYGVKHNILRMLAGRGCKLTVVPAQTPAAEVLAVNPDGVFLSNGPGDPQPCSRHWPPWSKKTSAPSPSWSMATWSAC